MATAATNNNTAATQTTPTARISHISPPLIALHITTESLTRGLASTEGFFSVKLNYSQGNKESSAYWLALGALEKNKTAATVLSAGTDSRTSANNLTGTELWGGVLGRELHY